MPKIEKNVIKIPHIYFVSTSRATFFLDLDIDFCQLQSWIRSTHVMANFRSSQLHLEEQSLSSNPILRNMLSDNRTLFPKETLEGKSENREVWVHKISNGGR